MEITIKDYHTSVCGVMDLNGIDISYCKVNIYADYWQISSWFTANEYKNRGLGRQVLTATFKYCISKYGEPKEIQYTWNGSNEYVKDWMVRNFDAKCTCPIAELKYNYGDTWASHNYILSIERVLDYIER